MTATVRPATCPPSAPPAAWALTGSAWLPGVRLVRAEFLKLARRRGLMIAGIVLTVGAVIACLAVGEFASTGFIVAGAAGAVATLLGVWAGAADVTAGVFGNLVTTGRSRVALFLARIPAGLTLSVAFALAGYGVAMAGSVLLAGSRPVPPLSFMLGVGGWLVLDASTAFLVSLGLSSLAVGTGAWRAVSRGA